MRKAFINARIYRDRALYEGSLAIENGVIAEYIPGEEALDVGGDILIPGLIDIHTHGRSGYDFCDASEEEMLLMKAKYADKGVTTVIPTLASDTLEKMLEKIALMSAIGFPAAHIEGRYLNQAKKGAHASHLIAPLKSEEVELFAKAANGMHLHFSCAFELDADGKFLSAIKSHGYTASLAHTNATYDEAVDCISRGVSSFTHLFNAMPPIHHRAGGAVAAALTSDAYTEIICDGLHLAPETVKLVKTAKSQDKVVLITDSMMGTGCEDGNFFIAGNPVVLKDGQARTPDGTLSGSTLDLLNGVKNYAAFTGASFPQAVACATENPASLIGLSDRGRLDVGCKADILRLGQDLKIKEVYIDGNKL